MARPKKNNLDYYPHDSSMRNHRKIKALRAKFGLEGYAIYNMLLETLCECDLLILKWDETEIELVSGDLTIVSEKLIEVSEYLNKINLINIKNGYVHCPELDKRSEGVFGKRTKDLCSLRIENGINVSETDVSDYIVGFYESETPQSKVKENKVKESIINNDEKFNFKKSLIDLGVDKKYVDDWLKVRKNKKATNSETSFNTIASQINKSKLSANDCIKLAIIKDWKGFNADWVKPEDYKLLEIKQSDQPQLPIYKDMNDYNPTS